MIFKLRNILGTRDGFEKPQARASELHGAAQPDVDIVEKAPEQEFSKYVEEGSDAHGALENLSEVRPDFNVANFVEDAKRAFEWILVKFTEGEIAELEDFLSDDVYESFLENVADRANEEICRVVKIVGFRKVTILDAIFDEVDMEAEIKVEFVVELISYATDEDNNIVEGSDEVVRRQTDVWTFYKDINEEGPVWLLVETGE